MRTSPSDTSGARVADVFERRRERVGADTPLALVLAQSAHAVVLLGYVRELEVQPERAQHARLPLERQRRDRVAQLVVRRALACCARECPHALNVREQRLVFLLDEHLPEQVAEQADVAPERCIRPLHRVTVGAKRSAFLLTR